MHKVSWQGHGSLAGGGMGDSTVPTFRVLVQLEALLLKNKRPTWGAPQWLFLLLAASAGNT